MNENTQSNTFNYVVCRVPSSGLLELGKKYTIATETEHGYKLFEVDPPKPFTSFHKNRFDLLQEKNEVIYKEFLSDQDEYFSDFNN